MSFRYAQLIFNSSYYHAFFFAGRYYRALMPLTEACALRNSFFLQLMFSVRDIWKFGYCWLVLPNLAF
jgi:hypothetical protein